MVDGDQSNRNFFEKLEELNTVGEFADLLWQGLADLHLPKDRDFGTNSDIWERVINERSESATMTLGSAYHGLSNDGQEIFRESLGIIFDRCADVDDPRVYDMARSLVFLSTEVEATHSLNNVLDLIENEQFMERNPKKGALPLALAIALKSHSAGEDLYDATERALESSSFPDGYVFSLIGNMMRCRPNDAEGIANRYRDRVTAMYHFCDSSPADKRSDRMDTYWREVERIESRYPAAGRIIRSVSYKPDAKRN